MVPGWSSLICPPLRKRRVQPSAFPHKFLAKATLGQMGLRIGCEVRFGLAEADHRTDVRAGLGAELRKTIVMEFSADGRPEADQSNQPRHLNQSKGNTPLATIAIKASG
jgi:hypothetical protein